MGLAFAISLNSSFVALAESPEAIKENDERMLKQMQSISQQLGVTCTACHIASNFASDEKPEFKKSLKHLKTTQLLIDNGFSGKNGESKASCYMCHREKLIPDSEQKTDPLLYKNFKK